MFRVSRSLRTLGSARVKQQAVQSLRPACFPSPAVLPLFSHAHYSSRPERRAVPRETKETSRGMVLPPVTREDTKEMSTAEICLYLKARKFHNYDVAKRKRGEE